MTTSASTVRLAVAGQPANPDADVGTMFRQHAPELGRYLVAMVRDRALAEDLLQDTFHDALRARSRLGEIEDERAWLHGIARHRALAALRRGRRLQRAVLRLGHFDEAAHGGDEALVRVLDLLERELSPDVRALILLRHVHGFNATELAEMTGLSSEAIRQRLARGRARLLAVTESKEV